MDKVFMKSFQDFFEYKIQLWFFWKREKKEHVANDSIYSELDVTTVAAFCWKFSSSEGQDDGFGDTSDPWFNINVGREGISLQRMGCGDLYWWKVQRVKNRLSILPA